MVVSSQFPTGSCAARAAMRGRNGLPPSGGARTPASPRIRGSARTDSLAGHRKTGLSPVVSTPAGSPTDGASRRGAGHNSARGSGTRGFSGGVLGAKPSTTGGSAADGVPTGGATAAPHGTDSGSATATPDAAGAVTASMLADGAATLVAASAASADDAVLAELGKELVALEAVHCVLDAEILPVLCQNVFLFPPRSKEVSLLTSDNLS